MTTAIINSITKISTTSICLLLIAITPGFCAKDSAKAIEATATTKDSAANKKCCNITVNCGVQTQTKSEKGDTLETINTKKVIEFTIDVIGKTIWPIIVLILGLVYRAQISNLLSRLKKSKVGGTEFEFEGRIKEIIDEVNDINPELLAKNQEINEYYGNDSRGLILSAWIDLEKAMLDVIPTLSIPENEKQKNANPANLIQMLNRYEVINNAQANILNELRHVRNLAVHSFDFSPDPSSVNQYLNLVKISINQIANRKYG